MALKKKDLRQKIYPLSTYLFIILVIVHLTTFSEAEEKRRLQRRKVSVAKFEVTFHHMSVMTWKNHDKTESLQPVTLTNYIQKRCAV
jgi:acyl carrier protein phosphodiesterase